MEITDVLRTEPLLNTNPLLSLQHLGIRLHRQVASQDVNPDVEIDQAEHLQLAGLNLLDFDQAYVLRAGDNEESIVLNTAEVNSQRLLGSLQQLGHGLDLNRALDLHHAARDMIASIRTAPEIPLDPSFTGYKLVLHGAFGKLELDFDKLQPDALHQAFAANLSEHSAQSLEASYEQLGALSHLVRAGFEDPDYHSILEQIISTWLTAAQHSDFNLEQLFQLAFGYSPLNEENSVKHLLRSFKLDNDSDLNIEQQTQSIQALVTALIEKANRLEQELTLTPDPNSPDVIQLFRHFQLILQQLDQDVTQLLAQQDQKSQLDHRILAHYAQRLHRNAAYHQQLLNDMQNNASQRLGILVSQALLEVQSKIWLAQSHLRIDPLQNSYQSLEKWLLRFQ